jgi:hypothetical protein
MVLKCNSDSITDLKCCAINMSRAALKSTFKSGFEKAPTNDSNFDLINKERDREQGIGDASRDGNVS